MTEPATDPTTTKTKGTPPMLIVLILLFDQFVLDETVPPLRWAGVAFIGVGIILVSQTQHT